LTELSGTLDGLGLSAIVRFLGGLNKSGRLRLSQHDWVGEVHFDSGRLTHASLGTRSGLTALDALVEVLPRASFSFDSHAAPTSEPTIQLSNDEVLAHLDEVVARVASGERRLPDADAIPAQTTIENGAEEPLQLDRAALQTLLIVDGQRSVREIVARRGSFDALWHLASLRDVGLISFEPQVPEHESAAVPEAAPVAPVAPVTPIAPEPVDPDATVVTPIEPVPQEVPVAAVGHCPKLGFEDDPASSFGRPTRLHRCFAAGKPLPLSLDQQRELCLSDHFETCPRLTGAQAPRPAPPTAEPAPSDAPRIVRLPLTGRPMPTEQNGPTGAVLEPRPLRPFANNPLTRDLDAQRPPTLNVPTPLRARLNRSVGAAAAATPVVAAVPESLPAPPVEQPPVSKPPREPQRPSVVDQSLDAAYVPLNERRVGPIPLLAIPVIGVVLVAVVALVIMLMPGLESLFSDNSLDAASLPNASLVEAGTPVADLGLSRPTPLPVRSTAVAVEGVQATAEPDPAAAQAQATPAAADAVQGPAPLFDERFTTNDAGWPSNPVGAALITNGTYRITTRQAGQFAAVGAPVANVPADVVVNATFRKLAGPAGGGYGIIVRDQVQTLRDGTSQDGQYYVLEVGDKGEVGIWRRDADHWVDLLPWQHADAVNTGATSNDLSVRAVGNTLSLSVNGSQVATRNDSTFSTGRAGLFVGGDGNQVAISRFSIQTP
jgi:hypothetical protein